MDPHNWKKPWSRLLKGKAIEVEETPELYLKFTTRCMEQVNRLCPTRGSPLPKFNQEQCKYLAIKLQLTIQSANSIINRVNKEFLSLAHPKEMEQLLEIFKLLSAMGMEVEGLIRNCCKKAWIQSAIMLTDTLEHVATIGLNLEFCTNIFSARQSQKRTTLAHFDAKRIRKAEVQIVKEKVDLDGMKLILDLENVIQSNASSSVEWQLATFLLGRLETVKLHPTANPTTPKERVLPLMITSLQQMPDCLGKGTFAIVHKATWIGVEVAKKTFYGPTSADFLREVSILDGLNHPNIVSLLWSMMDGKRCHLVMELMDEDLFSFMHQRMEENGNQGPPFNIGEALDLILQIGEGMLYLHEKRIVHRDLKSHNILIRCGKVAKENLKYLHVKVADFGLSKTKEHSATYSDLTLNVGTTRWMAPEVMRVGYIRSDDVDEEQEVALNYPFKIDIYSFGMVCFEILTGEVPFSSLNHCEVKKVVLSGARPPLPRECPYRLRTLIESCWSVEASMRPSFGNICEELRDLKYANLRAYWKATIYPCPSKDMATIDELVAKISSTIANVQRSAADDIYLLAKIGRAVGPIVKILKVGRMKAHENAAEALMKLSFDYGSKVRDKIRNSSALPALVTLLQDGSTKGKEYAAILLFRTCRSDEDFKSAARAGIVPPLMNLIAQQSSTMLNNAFRILTRLAKVREGLIAIAAVEPTPILVKLIASESRWNKARAARILLGLCLHDPRFVKEATESNAVEPLTHFAQHLLVSSSPKPPAIALLQLLQKREEKQEEQSATVALVATLTTNQSASAGNVGTM